MRALVRTLPYAFGLLALLAIPTQASAQRSFPPTWIEVGWGFSGTLGDWADQARNGTVWTGSVAVAYRPNLPLSLGYARHQFECERGPTCTLESDEWKVNSFRSQIEYQFRTLSGLTPYVRAGVSLNKLSFQSTTDFNGSYGIGFLGAAGFEVAMSEASSVALGARGEHFASDFSTQTSGNVQSWVVEFAFKYRVY